MLFASLALGLSACRSAPSKPSPKATASEPAVASGSAGPQSAPTVAAASAFIDQGFANEGQPELLTARRLFPSAFGFEVGLPQNDVNHVLVNSGRLFDRLATPPPHCLNSV